MRNNEIYNCTMPNVRARHMSIFQSFESRWYIFETGSRRTPMHAMERIRPNKLS